MPLNNNIITLGPTSRTNPTVGNESQFIIELQNVYSLPNPPKKSDPDFIPTLNTAWLSGIPAEWDTAASGQWIAPKRSQSTNISATSAGILGAGAVINIGASLSGIPQVAEIGDSLLGTTMLSSTYSTLDYDQLKPIPGVKYADFRARRVLKNSQQNSGGVLKIRLDGTSAATRKSVKAGLYAAASANPLGGAYAVFGLNGAGESGYGWGDHGNPYALRNDFTARSHVATKWQSAVSGSSESGKWVATTNPLEKITPFRGDRVSVIDFGKRSLSTAYKWMPTAVDKDGKDKSKSSKILNKLGLTQDFIKFFFTGPTLHAGYKDNAGKTDDIVVFRAIINSLSDSFAPNWTPVNMIGRADPNYHYTGVTRDLNLDFTVYATDRDELKPIWRKLNALAGFTAPKYNATDITLGAPWMRVTIGDVFYQQPMILTSLSYTLHDSETTWEINIEDDDTMMQVPHKVSVSCAFNVITDFLPQYGGRFYSLAKRYTAETDEYYGGDPIAGDDNWLSDFEGNATQPGLTKPRIQVGKAKQNESDKASESFTVEPPPRPDVTGDQGQVVGGN